MSREKPHVVVRPIRSVPVIVMLGVAFYALSDDPITALGGAGLGLVLELGLGFLGSARSSPLHGESAIRLFRRGGLEAFSIGIGETAKPKKSRVSGVLATGGLALLTSPAANGPEREAEWAR